MFWQLFNLSSSMYCILLLIDLFFLDMTLCPLHQFSLFIVRLKLCLRLRVPFYFSLFELGIILYKY